MRKVRAIRLFYANKDAPIILAVVDEEGVRRKRRVPVAKGEKVKDVVARLSAAQSLEPGAD